MSARLAIENLAVRRGAVTTLRPLSATLEAGQILAVLGANGAGKSSLMQALIGLVPATGEIRLEGRPLGRLSPAARARAGLGYAPEGRRLFPGLTVQETLDLACFDGRASRQDRRDLVFALFSQLADNRRQPAWQLSGGQQQMLSIGRALMSAPSVLLLDEPSFGLAPALLDSLLDTLGEIASAGTAILIAEQNIAALDIADRAIVLRLGEAVAAGAPADIRSALADAYVG